jgi:sigma-B regulation protein RsbU (phosphoserine phosphatase)
MFEHATYATNRVNIGASDLLLMYTDGITEAENPAGRPFDEAGLESVLSRAWMHAPLEIGRTLLQEVERFAEDARLADDLTALVLKRANPADAV